MKKVLITVPTSPANPVIHKSLVAPLIKILRDGRYKCNLILPSHNPFENNLHHIIKDFLASDCDYWLNIDADNPPKNNPLDLVELDKDIIGLPTPVLHFDEPNKKKGESPVYLNAYKKVKGGYTQYTPQIGSQEVDAVGTGCILFARRVFEHKDMQKGCFTRKLYPDGRVEKGNDISFCERAKKAGFKIWANFDYQCMHFNRVELSEMMRAFKNMYE